MRQAVAVMILAGLVALAGCDHGHFVRPGTRQFQTLPMPTTGSDLTYGKFELGRDIGIPRRSNN